MKKLFTLLIVLLALNASAVTQLTNWVQLWNFNGGSLSNLNGGAITGTIPASVIGKDGSGFTNDLHNLTLNINTNGFTIANDFTSTNLLVNAIATNGALILTMPAITTAPIEFSVGNFGTTGNSLILSNTSGQTFAVWTNLPNVGAAVVYRQSITNIWPGDTMVLHSINASNWVIADAHWSAAHLYNDGSNAAVNVSLPAANLTGSIADARLSANVALLNVNQTFNKTNTFTAPIYADGGVIVGGGSLTTVSNLLVTGNQTNNGKFVWLGSNSAAAVFMYGPDASGNLTTNTIPAGGTVLAFSGSSAIAMGSTATNYFRLTQQTASGGGSAFVFASSGLPVFKAPFTITNFYIGFNNYGLAPTTNLTASILTNGVVACNFNSLLGAAVSATTFMTNNTANGATIGQTTNQFSLRVWVGTTSGTIAISPIWWGFQVIY